MCNMFGMGVCSWIGVRDERVREEGGERERERERF